MTRTIRFGVGLAAAAAVSVSGPPVAWAADDEEPPEGTEVAGAAAPAGDVPQDAAEDERPGEPERDANNAIYAELLGPGGIASIDYDRTFGDVSGRIGLGYFSVEATATDGTTTASSKASLTFIPITVSYLGIGSKKHMLELGAGASIVHLGGSASLGAAESTEGSATTVLGVGIVGYRLQPADGGFFLRAGFSPLFGSGGVIPWWPHLGLGGVF
jgi:hypothetical protein